MRDIRVYIDGPIVVGQPLVIKNDKAHYLLRVLRLTAGHVIHLFNGEGGYYVTDIKETDRRSLTVTPVNFVGGDKESPLRLTLVQGISRGQKMDFTIQKTVELGVARIVPVMTEFSNVRLTEERTPSRIAHWNKIVISACEQCGRNRVPEILPPLSLKEWVEQDHSQTRLILHPDAQRTLHDLPAPAGEVALLSGPEGGLSDNDLKEAGSSGYEAVRLGPRILRTETAAVAAVAVCQGLWGDLK